MARFVLLPQDDLNLACLLKSPLVGLDEDKLFTLAWNRKTHLWQALRERAHEPRLRRRARAAVALAGARRLHHAVRFLRPGARARRHGRGLLLERLGREAADPIDELLARALQYQRTEAGSLQGFLRWFEAGGGEIKRDLDANRRQEVRILTVHASKGLQAPIVYLPDTTRVPSDHRAAAGRRRTARRGCGCRAPTTPTRPPARGAAEARRRSLEEQNRLLYVAMTRAEDRLYVGGWIGSQAAGPAAAGTTASGQACAASVDGESDEPRVQATAQDFRLHEGHSAAGLGGRRLRAGQPGPHRGARAAGPAARSRLPGSKPGRASRRRPSPIRRRRSRPRSRCPTRPLAGAARLQPAGRRTTRRWQRGRLLHELLRHLPALPAAERDAAAHRFLAQPAHGLERGGGRGMGRRGAGGHRSHRLTATCSPRARAPRCR